MLSTRRMIDKVVDLQFNKAQVTLSCGHKVICDRDVDKKLITGEYMECVRCVVALENEKKLKDKAFEDEGSDGVC